MRHVPDGPSDVTRPFLFCIDGRDLRPREIAKSLWHDQQVSGGAVCCALARSAEQAVIALGRDDVRPAHFGVDLLAPVSMGTLTIETTARHQSRRTCVTETLLQQDGMIKARATTVLLVAAEDPAGTVWDHHDDLVAPPPPDMTAAAPTRPLFWTPEAGWSPDLQKHQRPERHQVWSAVADVVSGETPSPFVTVAGVADLTNPVTNWGERGVGFINTDVRLSIVRLPAAHEVGLAATSRHSSAGLAVGTATVFDRIGPIGTAMVMGLAKGYRPVDLSGAWIDADGRWSMS